MKHYYPMEQRFSFHFYLLKFKIPGLLFMFVLLDKIGRRATICVSFVITAIAVAFMFIPSALQVHCISLLFL